MYCPRFETESPFVMSLKISKLIQLTISYDLRWKIDDIKKEQFTL